MHRLRINFFSIALVLLSIGLQAQSMEPGQPLWLQYQDSKRPYLQTLELPAPAPEEVRRTQDQFPELFALPVNLAINPDQQGQWLELDNGDRVWWLRVKVKDARALGLLYNDFYLPPGARLFMFTPDGSEVLGAYTRRNNPVGGRFKTGFTSGESFILEYYEPAPFRGKGNLEIFRLDYAFDSPEQRSGGILSFGFGTADTCNININCPEGANWQDEKRGVCRIQMVLVEGTGWCSGSLINNAEEDAAPYILTGFHCQDGYTPMYDLWRFDFNYEGPSCSNPGSEPAFQSVLGCIYRSGYQASDFLLVESLQAIPGSFGTYFNGWDRSASVPQTSTHIHHPQADIKKISIDDQPAIIHPAPINWNNGVTTPANHHFRVVFDHGTFEPGSSGGPLFNQNGLIVAQLHGGVPGCDQVTTYHGRFFMSWTGGGNSDSRLENWLDPGDTGQTSLPGMDNPANGAAAEISGRIATDDGQGIGSVTVILSGAVADTVVTDTSGTYSFPDLPTGLDYTITPIKDLDADNGVTTLDMVEIQKHILGLDLLDSPLEYISADANHSGSVSTLDMVAIQKVILQLEPGFPNNTSWRFADSSVPLSDPPVNFPEYIDVINLTGDLSDQDFTGTKIGDVNQTANPYN